MPDEDAQDAAGSPLQIGQIIAGKYRIERQIGRGGMGVVLAATHLQLEALVAIKVMRRDVLEDDNALSRLLVEARSAAKIRSEHVARVLDVGTLEEGLPFIVLEYLEGEDLADLLDREGALEVEQAIQFMLHSCEALAEVHMAEMVHRDLKPGNLFIARMPDGSLSVKIVDFGISKQIGGSARERAATTSPQVLGSPFYMAPEQMRAEAVDERSDIWALGAILFEMLTGRPPFVAETLPEVYAAVLSSAPPPVDELRPEVPPGLDDVVQRCLDKDPAQRFCDVADLAEALAPFGGPGSLASVERITRILTNPEPLRVRPSVPPTLGPAAARPGLPAGELSSDRVAAMESGRASGVPGQLARVGSGGGAEPAPRWAAQGAPAPGPELRTASSSASGLEVETHSLRPRRTRLVASVVLLLGVVFGGVVWLRALEPAVTSRALGRATSSAAAGMTRGAGAVPGPLEETKSLPQEETTPRQAASGSEVRVEERALQPLRAGTSRREPPSISVGGFRAAVADLKKAERKRPRRQRPRAPARRRSPRERAGEPAVAASAPEPGAAGAATPGASGAATPEPRHADPWDPASFGGRR